jgi:hypothetical protein
MGREDHARKVYPSDLTDAQWAIVAPASERSKRDLADDDRKQKEESTHSIAFSGNALSPA